MNQPQRATKPTPTRELRLPAEALHAIDCYADTVREAASISQLAQQLGRPAHPVLKARGIYRWIAQFVAYDVEAFFTGRIADDDPQVVLSRRKGMCGGYARLFEALCHACGLTAVTLVGKVKGYSFATNGSLGGHAWNAVFLEGGWRLVDVTWGSGAIDADRNFSRSFKDHYFAVPPHQLANSHFPDDPAWQLMTLPLDLDTFINQPRISVAAFNLGIAPASHRNRRINAPRHLAISFHAGTDAKLLAKIGGIQALPSQRCEFVAFHAPRAGIRTIELTLPKDGLYRLQLFANAGNSNQYDLALEYLIQACGR
ncbi:transglutaminase domain-containing protein [Magnetospirillum sulfuroxidans]|uniref:Transglutaminase-like domain-containing protein n=1 Tax=Magnetospirillum sulfuroxidans TaxID=611300 RepID=A0ABS5IGN0_9PROT|nr:transglutaminase domain-containing protein [Magnetospirillum sulfuroxidans]MBR9972893.1 hypothetical protein [Magnetospirillum sulfuroxidans]